MRHSQEGVVILQSVISEEEEGILSSAGPEDERINNRAIVYSDSVQSAKVQIETFDSESFRAEHMAARPKQPVEFISPL